MIHLQPFWLHSCTFHSRTVWYLQNRNRLHLDICTKYRWFYVWGQLSVLSLSLNYYTCACRKFNQQVSWMYFEKLKAGNRHEHFTEHHFVRNLRNHFFYKIKTSTQLIISVCVTRYFSRHAFIISSLKIISDKKTFRFLMINILYIVPAEK